MKRNTWLAGNLLVDTIDEAEAKIAQGMMSLRTPTPGQLQTNAAIVQGGLFSIEFDGLGKPLGLKKIGNELVSAHLVVAAFVSLRKSTPKLFASMAEHTQRALFTD